MTNIKESNRFMLILIIWALPASLFTFIFTSAMGASTGILILISQFLTFGIPSIVVLSMYSKNIKTILPIRKMGTKNYLMIIAMSLAIQPILMLTSAILSQFIPNVSAEILGDMNMESNFILVLLFIAVVPSIFEELVFRGIIFSGYKEIPIFKAALLNGLLFGIIHLNFHQFFYTAILGFILCYFVYYTKSIISAVLAHFVLNGVQAGISHFTTSPQQTNAAYNEPSIFLVLAVLGIVGTVGLAVFAAIFKRFKLHNASNIHTPNDEVTQECIALPESSKKPSIFTVPIYISIALFVIFAFISLLPSFIHSCPYC